MTAALHAIAQLGVLRAVDSLVEGSFVALFAAAILRVAGKHNAGSRFAISFSALMAIAFLPLIALSHQAGISGASHSAITVSQSWALYLFGVWALIAGWSLLRLGKAMSHLRTLRNSCVPMDVRGLDPLLQDTLRRHSGNRKFVLCTSDQVSVPTALGLFKPAIVIPHWVMHELSPAELNQIVLHELAHLRRWDDWTNLAQQLVRALFFFHPAVWWIEKRVALEREMACDDAVLTETSPRAYAECLARLAEKSFVRRSVALAQAALGKIRQTSARIAQILNVNRPVEQAQSWRPAVSLVAGFAVVCATGISRTPSLVAFQDSAEQAQQAAAQNISSGSAPQMARTVMRSAAPLPSVAAVPTKLKTETAHRGFSVPMLAAGARSVTSNNTDRANMVHLAGSKTHSAPVTQTIFVVIESGDNTVSGQPMYQIQMWRVTLFHPIVDSGSQSPRKTT
jgi:bla regulator protein blaR1